MQNNSYNTIRNMLTAMMEVPVVLTGKVLSVDKTARCCDVDIDGLSLPGALLQPIIDGSAGMVVFPAVGAQVLLLYNPEWDGWVVLLASHIESIIISVDNTSLHISDKGVVLNNGKNGGLVNINTLRVEFDKVVKDISAIKADLSLIATAAGVVSSFIPSSSALPDSIEDSSFTH